MDNIQWGNSTRAQDIINNITGVSINPAPNPAPAPTKTQPGTPEFPKNSWESYATSPKRAIRTYRADTADLLRSEPVSLAHITITEQSKGTHSQVIRNFGSTAKNYSNSIKSFFRVTLYTLISLFLVSGALMLLIIGVSQYKFGFLGQGLNNLADNYAGRIYTFLGLTKNPTEVTDSNQTTTTGTQNKPVFSGVNNRPQNNTQDTRDPGTQVSTNKPNTGNSTQTNASIPGILINGIIKVDSESSVSIRRGTTLAGLIQESIANKDLKVDELVGINIYNPKEDGTNNSLKTEELFIAIASRAPESARKPLNEDFVVGYSGPGKNPFLILTTSNFPEAFAGMLAWESTLYDDFATIFTLPIIGGLSVNQRQIHEYGDGLILSRDVRILKSIGARPPLYYGFVDKNTILITTSDAVFKKITERLDSAAYIRQK